MAVFKFRNLKNGQATPIPPGEFTVGRADDTYVHIEDASVSRRHAMLLNNDQGFFIEDLNSANGTAARGAYITRRMKIGIGDVVYIGSVPFRVDPEVAGEPEVAPSAGLRSQNRAYMRRDTERLPQSGNLPRPVEPVAQETLSAPEVNPETHADAEELNAVTMQEPETPVVEEHEQEQEQPPANPASVALTAQANPARQAVSIPSPQRQAPIQQQPRPSPAVLDREAIPLDLRDPRPIQREEPAEQPAEEIGWGWWLTIFLAGMGTGLLLGLYFAKLFIDMGGKAALLP